MKWFEGFVEFVFWLRLAFSPILTSIIVGGIISMAIDGVWGYILWGIILLAGIIGGVKLAEYARKKRGGTAHFSSRVMASEDLDNFDPEKPEKRSNSTSTVGDSGLRRNDGLGRDAFK